MIEDLPKTIRSYLEGRRAEYEDLQLKDLGLSSDAPLSSSGILDKPFHPLNLSFPHYQVEGK